MSDDRAPVLVGVAQLVQRDADPREALDPLQMLERIARDAAGDARVAERALCELDAIGIVQVVAWRAANPARLLAERLGAQPAREYLTRVGGELPIAMLNRVAGQIRSGAVRAALLAGCNNVRTLRRAHRDGVALAWPEGNGSAPTMIGEERPGSSDVEGAYGLKMPIHFYPIFENALRAHRGLDLAAHRGRVGRLMSRFSEVAAGNPYAWFPVARTPEEIANPSPANRMVAYPYTKYLNAVMETDQAAGVLLTSAETARAWGVPEERLVYWWGGRRSVERSWYASGRPDFTTCPALAAAVDGALAAARVGLDEIDAIDLYSCFPSAVQMACEMLGLAEDDPRGLTVTGGLPYAGGPGNNYTLHSVATMVDRLRQTRGSKGLVTGNGWYLTKHSAAVLASAPCDGAVPPAVEPEADDREPVSVADQASGRARIETYTVLYDREGAPKRGIVVGRLERGPRFLANTPDDRALLEAFVAREDVGRGGTVAPRDGHNVFDPS